MCDLFSLPLKLAQDEPRLHFTSMQAVEGQCGPPRCYTSDCSMLVFDDLFYQLDVSTSAATDLPPGTLCRYTVSSKEGESLNLAFSLASSYSSSFCCNTGLRKLVAYSWSGSANGVEMKLSGGGGMGPAYFLPTAAVDGGVPVDASID